MENNELGFACIETLGMPVAREDKYDYNSPDNSNSFLYNNPIRKNELLRGMPIIVANGIIGVLSKATVIDIQDNHAEARDPSGRTLYPLLWNPNTNCWTNSSAINTMGISHIQIKH